MSEENNGNEVRHHPALRDSQFVEYTDPVEFLELVKGTFEDRPIQNVVVLVMDRNGGITMHSSTPNPERVSSLLDVAKAHAIEMFRGAVAKSAELYQREQAGLTPSVTPIRPSNDEDETPPPTAA